MYRLSRRAVGQHHTRRERVEENENWFDCALPGDPFRSPRREARPSELRGTQREISRVLFDNANTAHSQR